MWGWLVGSRKAVPGGLLAEIVVADVGLDGVHDLWAEETDDGGVDAGGHDAVGVAGGDEAVVGREVLEVFLVVVDIGEGGEAGAEGGDHVGVGFDEP
jgi:hypothetical protein